MDNKILIALVSRLVDDSIAKFKKENPILKGDRGPRGISGRDGIDGETGKSGKDFSFDENYSEISNIISEKINEIKEDLKIKFEDLSELDKKSISGKDGKSFSFAENESYISEIISEYISKNYKLKFEDLSEDEKKEIRGPRGLKGQVGRSGKDFSFEENKENIKDIVLENKEILKLRFEDLSDFEKKQIRGQRGLSGMDGKDGQDGKDFSFEENKENVKNIVLENKDILRLRFEDLSEEDKSSLKGPRGIRGQKGKSFSFEEESVNIKNLIIDNSELLKLKYSDLNEDQKIEIRGPKGKSGKDGISFVFEDEKSNIRELIINSPELKLKFEDLKDSEVDKLKLKFENLTEEDKLSIRGPRGIRGQKGRDGIDGVSGINGKDFSFEENKENIKGIVLENKDILKLKFDELSEEDKLSIRGPRGQKGKIGISGEDGKDFSFEENKENISGLIIENKESLRLKFSDLTEDEKKSLRGARGLVGLKGLSGKDGKDAREIVDVEIDSTDDWFEISFYFNDGTKLTTNRVDIPVVEKIYNHYYNSYGNSSGSGSGNVIIEKDGIEFGVAEKIDFVGDGLDVSYDSIEKRVTIEAKESCLAIYDEGIITSDCAKNINFVGDNVEVLQTTMMADWLSLDLIDSIGLWESATPQFVTVKVNAPQKFTIRKIASDNVSALDLISLDSQTTGKRGDIDSYNGGTIAGIALTSASLGQEFEILVFGVLDSNTFNFSVNNPLFLGSDGRVTEVAITDIGKYRTKIGKSYGDGSIFIDVQETKQVV